MKNPFMPFWVDDYVRGVKRLSLEAKGLYVDMILELWVVGEWPDDQDLIAGELGLNPRLFKRVFKLISHKFTTKDGLISHSRVTKERLKLFSKSDKARESANSRWNRDANASKTHIHSQCYTDSDTDSYSELNKDKKKSKHKETSDEVLSVFDHYFKTFKKSESYKLTKPREKMIEKAFKEGFKLQDLVRAIDLMSKDDWEERGKYSDIKYAIEITAKNNRVEQWLEKSESKTKQFPDMDLDYLPERK